MRIGTAMVAPAIVPGSAHSKLARPDTTAAPSPLENYLKRDLQFKTLESYRSLNLDINPGWSHDDRADAMELVANSARENKAMEVLWIGGYYDLSTPVFAEEANRRVLATRLRAWVPGCASD